jgi:mono/diheme cytochrome c family protein
LQPSPDAADSRKTVLDEGRMEFEENCVACHAKDGTEARGVRRKVGQPAQLLSFMLE